MPIPDTRTISQIEASGYDWIAGEYRHAIEHATIRAELASSDEIKRLWLHIHEHYNYLYLLKLDSCMNANLPLHKSAEYGRAFAFTR